MREAVRWGLVLRREHGIRGVAREDDVGAVVAAAGLRVCPDYPFAGRIRGFLIGGTIYLRRRMAARERTIVLAHELGHHIMHESTAFYLRAPGQRLGATVGRAEREADLFAGALVAGRPLDDPDEFVAWMAEAHADGVPAELLWTLASDLAARR